jgi:hypothetical protein
MMVDQPAIALHKVARPFGDTVAPDGANIDLAPGELVGLPGDDLPGRQCETRPGGRCWTAVLESHSTARSTARRFRMR